MNWSKTQDNSSLDAPYVWVQTVNTVKSWKLAMQWGQKHCMTSK